jgi:phage/plasmid-associated DNA primase
VSAMPSAGEPIGQPPPRAPFTITESNRRIGLPADDEPGLYYAFEGEFVGPPTLGEWLQRLDDARFEREWRQYSNDERIPQGLQRELVARFRSSTRYVDETIKRLEREDRSQKGASLEDGAAQALIHAATEDAVALAFAMRHRDDLRFNHRRKRWHAWDGTRWRDESTELAFEFARRIARESNKSTASKAAFARGVEAFARADRVFALVGDEFDCDPMLLNTPAGTIDLRTRDMHEHRREDLLTKCTTVGPVNGPRSVFDRFIAEITCGDASLADYLQRGLGSCLSGAQTDHWLMFWYGLGRNGKNTLGELVMGVMGDYARKIPAQTLMHDARGERHPTEIANLVGVRLAFSSESATGTHSTSRESRS